MQRPSVVATQRHPDPPSSADLIFSNRISRFLIVIGHLLFVILLHESSLSLLG
jgi:hypothetical protein